MKDAIDIGAVQIHNSPNVMGWPISATITKLEFRPTGVHVEHTKNQGLAAWPNFRPAGWDGDLQYTLWIFLQINGAWHGSGCIQFWQSCDQNGGPPEQFAANWYYDANRWGPMTGHQPAVGELVGFMVSAGDARNSGIVSVQERSAIVGMPFPSSGVVYNAPADDPVPVPQPPTPLPAPPAPPSPEPTPTEDLTAQFQAIQDKLEALRAQNIDLSSRLETLETLHNNPSPKAWKGQIKVFGVGISFTADTPVY